MNELSKMRMFCLLAETSQKVTNEQMQRAYGCFLKRVETVSQSETDYSKTYWTLNITRAELVFIESLYRHGQGEKCPQICLSSKSVGTH
jgi:hypothetical protein